MKLKPFYQGKLDVFCAMYAVLNALRLTHGLRTLKARDILNETLLGLSTNTAAFRAVLNQQTDYIAIVDGMLKVCAKSYPLEIVRPFKAELPDVDTFWQACLDWLNPAGAPAPNRALIFRFSRHDKIGEAPSVRHWTTVDQIDSKNLHLFDSSHEAESIQNILKENIVTRSGDVDAKHRLYVQPDSLRLLRLPF